MHRLACLCLFVIACADPVEPPLPAVTVEVSGRPDSMGTTQGCTGTFMMATRTGPEQTFVSVAVLRQDLTIQATYQVFFQDNYVLMAPYFPIEPGQPNAVRFSYYARPPHADSIPPTYIEALCGSTVTHEH